MNKILITKKNIPYDNTYKNVFHFNTEEERDTYINTYIHENFITDLNNQKEVNFIPTSSLFATVELGFKSPDMLERNYVIVLKGNKRIFYFINNISISASNEKLYRLDLEYDIFMNRFNLMDQVQNFNLIKGHSGSSNYLENTYDLPSKIVEKIEPIKKNPINEIYEQLNETSWLVVLQKVTDVESDKGKRILKIINGKETKEPYKVYIAPLIDIQDSNAGASQTSLYDKDVSGEIRINLEGGTNITTTPITIYTPITSNQDLKFKLYFHVFGDYQIYKTLIKHEQLPLIDGEEKILAFNGDSEGAESMNQIVVDDGIYTLNDNIESSAGTNRLYKYFFKLKKVNDLEYQLITPTGQELINTFPNVRYISGGTEYNYSSFILRNPSQAWTVFNFTDKMWIDLYNMDGITNGYWTSNELVDFYNRTDNSTLITAKKTNYNPLLTTQTSGVFSSSSTFLKNAIKEDGIMRLININYDLSKNINSYRLQKDNLNNIEKINGLFPYEINYENNKVIEIETNAIEDDGSFTFNHYASFTPEWSESVKFVSSKGIELTNENNTWENTKDFVMGTNEWKTYKASNPVSSALAPLKDLSKVFTGAAKGFAVGGFAGAASGASAGVIGGVGNIIGRQDMKRKPNDVSGSGDALGDSIWNEIGDRFGLVTYKYIGTSRDFVIKNIKREGITYNLGYYITAYSTIKRPIFNFIQSVEISNDKITIDTSKEIKDKIADTIASGITLWNDYNNYLNYEIENGD